MNSSLVISVIEARKILGKQSKELSDDQIIELILLLTDIATIALKSKTVPKNH